MDKNNMTVKKARKWLKKAIMRVANCNGKTDFLALYDDFIIVDAIFGHSKVTESCGTWQDLNAGRCCLFHQDLEILNRKLETIAGNFEFVSKHPFMSSKWIRDFRRSCAS